MIWKKIDLSHRGLLFDRLKGITEPLSEYSFANVYLFRHIHEYEICTEGEPLVRGRTYDGESYILPTADLRTYSPEKLKELQKLAKFFFPLPENWLEHFKDCGLEISSDEGDWDYIYTVEKMCTYKGRKLHKKRNLLKQFREEYSHFSRPLRDYEIEVAGKILEQWQESSGQTVEETDYVACKEALRYKDELGLCGIIYYADDRPAGFILGEELNCDTFVMHFAKGLTEFKGIYQYLYNNFAKILPERYTYLNFEQDLGKTALRQAKSSYIPDYMLKKYRAKFTCK
jgi:hypothetical protein